MEVFKMEDNQEYPWRRKEERKQQPQKLQNNQHFEELKAREERQKNSIFKDNINLGQGSSYPGEPYPQQSKQPVQSREQPVHREQQPVQSRERQPVQSREFVQQRPVQSREQSSQQYNRPPQRQQYPPQQQYNHQPQQQPPQQQPVYQQPPVQQQSQPQQPPLGGRPVPPLSMKPKKSKKRVVLYSLMGLLGIAIMAFIVSLIMFFIQMEFI